MSSFFARSAYSSIVREKEVSEALIWPVKDKGQRKKSPSGLSRGIPCKAGEDEFGESAKASRSLRTAEDCFRAELKRGFCIRCISECC